MSNSVRFFLGESSSKSRLKILRSKTAQALKVSFYNYYFIKKKQGLQYS